MKQHNSPEEIERRATKKQVFEEAAVWMARDLDNQREIVDQTNASSSRLNKLKQKNSIKQS